MRWLVVVTIVFFSGCAHEKYYNAFGDECETHEVLLFRQTNCIKGTRRIEVNTDEKKDVDVRVHTPSAEKQ